MIKSCQTKQLKNKKNTPFGLSNNVLSCSSGGNRRVARRHRSTQNVECSIREVGFSPHISQNKICGLKRDADFMWTRRDSKSCPKALPPRFARRNSGSGFSPHISHNENIKYFQHLMFSLWTRRDSNPRPPHCKCDAPPIELRARNSVYGQRRSRRVARRHRSTQDVECSVRGADSLHPSTKIQNYM